MILISPRSTARRSVPSPKPSFFAAAGIEFPAPLKCRCPCFLFVMEASGENWAVRPCRERLALILRAVKEGDDTRWQHETRLFFQGAGGLGCGRSEATISGGST